MNVNSGPQSQQVGRCTLNEVRYYCTFHSTRSRYLNIEQFYLGDVDKKWSTIWDLAVLYNVYLYVAIFFILGSVDKQKRW